MSKRMKKCIASIMIAIMLCAMLVGCGSKDNGKETQESSTTEQTTTTETPTTTKKPSTQQTTVEDDMIREYVYRGTKVYMTIDEKEYFSDLILEEGDKIYINDIFPDESSEYDGHRGSLAYALLAEFKMKEERKKLSDKYWDEGTYVPMIPYSDNYVIEYRGKKIQFIFAEMDKDGDGVYFDMIKLE